MRAYMLVQTTVDGADFLRPAREIAGVAQLEKAVAQVHYALGLKSGDTRIARSA